MVEVLILSVDEPQLERSMESLRNQTIPFSNIVHINGVVPQSEAYNLGLEQIRDDWFVLMAGDVILNLDAVEIAVENINQRRDDKICAYIFKLFDTFLDEVHGGVGFALTSAHKGTAILDRLRNDRALGLELKNKGWVWIKINQILGTHFDRPDEFQVFRRFYALGRKFSGRYGERLRNRVIELGETTGDLLYSMAVKAFDFSREKGRYPGSHNLDFDRKMFEEFNESIFGDSRTKFSSRGCKAT